MSKLNISVVFCSLIRWQGDPSHFAFLLYSIFHISLWFIEKFLIFYNYKELPYYPIIYLLFGFAFARLVWILILVTSFKLNTQLCGCFRVIVTFNLNVLLWTEKLWYHSKHVFLISWSRRVKSSFWTILFICLINNEILFPARGNFNITKICLY